MADEEPLTGFRKFAKSPIGFAVGIILASLCVIALYYLDVERIACGLGFLLIGALIHIIVKRFGCDSNPKMIVVALCVFIIVTGTGIFAVSIPNIENNSDWHSYEDKDIAVSDMKYVSGGVKVEIVYSGSVTPDEIDVKYMPLALTFYKFYTCSNAEYVKMIPDGEGKYTATINDLSADNVFIYKFKIVTHEGTDEKTAETKDGAFNVGGDSVIKKSALVGNSYFVSLSIFLYLIISFFMRRASKNLEETRKKMEAEGRLYPKGYGRCKQCGTIILPGETSCRKCGAYIEVPEELKHKKVDYFQCSECGAEVPSDSTVCPKCGATFDEDEETVIVDSRKEE